MAIQAVLTNTLKSQAAIREESEAAKAELSDAKGSVLALRELINSMQVMQSQRAADADAAVKKLQDEDAKLSQNA